MQTVSSACARIVWLAGCGGLKTVATFGPHSIPFESWDMNPTQLSREQVGEGKTAGSGSPSHICGLLMLHAIHGFAVGLPILCKPKNAPGDINPALKVY